MFTKSLLFFVNITKNKKKYIYMFGNFHMKKIRHRSTNAIFIIVCYIWINFWFKFNIILICTLFGRGASEIRIISKPLTHNSIEDTSAEFQWLVGFFIFFYKNIWIFERLLNRHLISLHFSLFFCSHQTRHESYGAMIYEGTGKRVVKGEQNEEKEKAKVKGR